MNSSLNNLTYNNHLTWSVGDRPFGRRESSDEVFKFSIQSKPTSKSWYDELKIGLSNLVDVHGYRLNLFYSGGFDSEILLREFKRLGVRLSVWTIRFSEGENASDVDDSIEVCKQLGLTKHHHILDVNILDRMQSLELRDASLKYQCSQVAYLNVLLAARLLDGPCIMGGEVYLQKHQKPGPKLIEDAEWYYIYREDEDGCTYRFSDIHNIPLINEVFSYTPEMIWSWYQVPSVNRLVTNQVEGKLVISSVKSTIFAEAYPFPLQVKSKHHGFEKLGIYNSTLQSSLKQMLHRTGTAYVPVKFQL